MPETRAAKRIKFNNPQKTLKTSQVAGSSHYEARLKHLNSLPASDFLQKYVPEQLQSFRPSKHAHTEYVLEYYNAQSLPKQEFTRCYDLIVETSRADYAGSSRGWHAKRKQLEMREEKMRYFIVRGRSVAAAAHVSRAETGSPVGSVDSASQSSSSESKESEVSVVPDASELDEFGFMSFQLDDDWVVGSDVRIPILYLYEIHLGRSLRGLGLGCHLMGLARHIAQVTQMHKVELSVFTVNDKAELFYRSLGYRTDETSPETVKKGKKRIKADWLVLSLDLRTSLVIRNETLS